MTVGDLEYVRFPITLDIDAPADSIPQSGVPFSAFPDTDFDIVIPEILPITGTGGNSKGVVIVVARLII